MDADHFDAMVRSLSSSPSRRGALAGVVGSALGLFTSEVATEAKKRRKRKKKKLVPPPPLPPAGCQADCVGRVCGPNSCGAGSCGDCGPCKNCQGGACFDKVNGVACGGACEECQGGQCVLKANGADCGENESCQGGQCICPDDRICNGNCCPSDQACARIGNENFQCVSRLGTCSIGDNYCATPVDANRCGSALGCFCWQSFAGGETRCGVGAGDCNCTKDSDCSDDDEFCARDAAGSHCASCGEGVGFCTRPCRE